MSHCCCRDEPSLLGAGGLRARPSPPQQSGAAEGALSLDPRQPRFSQQPPPARRCVFRRPGTPAKREAETEQRRHDESAPRTAPARRRGGAAPLCSRAREGERRPETESTGRAERDDRGAARGQSPRRGRRAAEKRRSALRFGLWPGLEDRHAQARELRRRARRHCGARAADAADEEHAEYAWDQSQRERREFVRADYGWCSFCCCCGGRRSGDDYEAEAQAHADNQ